MKHARIVLILAALVLPALAHDARAAACVAGHYVAGCTGAHGTAAVRRPTTTPVYHGGTVYRSGGATGCAAGVYRAGCTGPNGTTVVRPRY